MQLKFFLFCFLLVAVVAHAQTDTASTRDTIKNKFAPSSSAADSLQKDSFAVTKKARELTWQQDTAFNKFFYNKKLPKNKQSVYAINAVRKPVHEDEPFYILAGLLLFAGTIRALFPKYFATLFQVFFQSSQHQRYPKESIAQDALPSFLMNIFFVLSGGLLITTFIKSNGGTFHSLSLVMLWLYASAVVAVVYIAKSLFLSFFGWAFGAQEPVAHYRFVVFLVNKMAGLFFIPLLLLFIYSGADVTVVTTLVITIIVALLLYRFIISLSLIGKKLKIHPLHFFLYLCAAEILPLLLTYKVLLITREL